MLGKLCKHELRATARWFLPLFGLVLILSPINRFTIPTMDKLDGILQVIPGFIMFAYVISLVIMFAATVLLIVFRFYKSMVTDEGYLTHTLPVSVSDHILSKMLVGALWTLASIVVFMLSLFILMFSPDGYRSFMDAWPYVASVIREVVGTASMTVFLAEIFILMLGSIITAPLVYYASIALGQVLAKNKIAGSIAGFFIISVASNIITGILMVPVTYMAANYDYNNFGLFTQILLPGSIAILILSAGIYYFITYYIFKNKLNLE